MSLMPKTARGKTALVMGILVLLALAWEAFTLSTGEAAQGGAWTISRLVWSLTDNPLFVFAFGVLMGHFFFPKSKCLHCGFVPYRRSDESARAFNHSLEMFATFIYVKGTSSAQLDNAKRHAGFPVFSEW